MEKLKIGLVIADEWEFVPMKKWAEKFNFTSVEKYKSEIVYFPFSEKIDIVAIEGGVGKVNAAFATSYLIFDEKCDIILNIGLSGAIKNVYKGDIVAGSEYIECDFDMTVIDYKPGEKPGGQDYLYSTDKKLLSILDGCKIDHIVRLGTGDIFLADKELKDYYEKTFDISSFDMETGAIAAVCFKTGTPHLSIRKISDDCDEAAVDSYRELNNKAELHLSEVLEEVLNKIQENY